MISDDQLRRVLPAPAVALLGDLIRWALWGLVAVVWIAFAQVYARMIRLTLTDPSHSDFTIFYYTARLVADGLPMYGVSPTRYGIEWAADHLGNLNPPHLVLLSLPLGKLSYGSALAAWVAVSLAALTTALAIIVRELQLRWAWSRFWLWGAWTLSSAAFTTVAVTCELTFVLLLPFTLAWRAWRRERWVAAGAWLGACASVKLFLLLFVPWLAWQRKWRALASFAGTMAALVAIGSAVFGIDAYRQWVATLGRVGWWWLTMNASWHGLVSRALQGASTVTPLVKAPGLVPLVAAAGAALVILATLWRSRSPRVSGDGSFLLLFLGALLGSPLGWVYYLPLAYGPILGWMGATRDWEAVRHRSRAVLALLMGGIGLLYIPHEVTLAGQPNPLATITVGSSYFWGVLSIWLALLLADPA